MTNFQSNPTFTACVRATWVFFEKIRKFKKPLKSFQLNFGNTTLIPEVFFHPVCLTNVQCKFWPAPIARTFFDRVHTRALTKTPENRQNTVKHKTFRSTISRDKRRSNSNSSGLVGLPGCKRGKSYSSKTLPRWGHNLSTIITLKHGFLTFAKLKSERFQVLKGTPG